MTPLVCTSASSITVRPVKSQAQEDKEMQTVENEQTNRSEQGGRSFQSQLHASVHYSPFPFTANGSLLDLIPFTTFILITRKHATKCLTSMDLGLNFRFISLGVKQEMVLKAQCWCLLSRLRPRSCSSCGLHSAAEETKLRKHGQTASSSVGHALLTCSNFQCCELNGLPLDFRHDLKHVIQHI